MSSSDGPLGAQSLDQTSVSVDSTAFAFNGDASSTDDTSSSGATAVANVATVAPASPSGSTETASEQAQTPLAVAASAPQSPALVAANAAVAGSGEPVAVPTPSPRDAAAATEVATTGTEVVTAADAQDDDEPPASVAAAASAPAADTATPIQAGQQASPLARLFSSNRAGQRRTRGAVSSRDGETASIPSTRVRATAAVARSADTISTGSTGTAHLQLASATTGGEQMDSLPGVRLQSLYEFPQADQDATGRARIELASAAGMARLAPGFLVKQRETVQTSCLKPALLGLLKLVQYHYGEPVVITSGYRGAAHNSRVGGVRHSKHMSCEAADIQVDGISKWDLAGYLRSLPGRGGVGTYCYTDSVHLDIGEKRDWNWRCRRRK